MSPRIRIAALWLAVAAAPLLGVRSACAWTARTQERVAENAAVLMPFSLREILRIHKDRLLEGTREAQRRLPESAHFQDLETGSGNLSGAVETESRRILMMLNARAPLGDVALEMGILSHLLTDAQNPLATSSREPREGEYSQDFEAYVDRKLDSFPLVFYGYETPELSADDYRGFAEKALERSSRYYDWLTQDFVRDGQIVSSQNFSDFSFAFGAGQLAFSHAVCDVSSAWLHLWRAGGGDVTGLPMSKAPIRIRQEK